MVSSRSLIWVRFLAPKLASKAGGATVAPPTIEADSWPRKRPPNRDRKRVHATSGGVVWAGVLRCSGFRCLGFGGFWVSRFQVFGFGGLRVSGLRCSGFWRPIRGSAFGSRVFVFLVDRFVFSVLGASSFWFSGFRCLGFGFRVFDARVSGFGVVGLSDFDFWCSDFRILAFRLSVLWLSGFRFVGFQIWGFLVGAAQAAAASGRHRQPPQAAATGSR